MWRGAVGPTMAQGAFLTHMTHRMARVLFSGVARVWRCPHHVAQELEEAETLFGVKLNYHQDIFVAWHRMGREDGKKRTCFECISGSSGKSFRSKRISP